MLHNSIHNSRILRFRSPQGPVGTNDEISLYISTPAETATLAMRSESGEEHILMTAEDGGYRATVRMPSTTGLVWYCFILTTSDGEILYYGGESGEGGLYPADPPAYQITVYDPGFTTPKWFREGIMYQIFPDRFNRGSKSEKGLNYHRALGRKPRVHENWGDEPCYLPGEGQYFYTPNDFFMGDLQGLEEKLPYLEDMGVTCVYLNPVFESASNHRYDTADYKRIDPILGDNEHFKSMCEKFKRHGIRIMLDGVFSHTGADSVYFNKYGRYDVEGAYQSPDSPYRSWYEFGSGTGYRSWWGFSELPEVSELAEDYLDFVIDGKDSLISYWAQNNMTSWRLDVADELPDQFISRFRARLKAVDQESVLLGEVWEDASTKEAYGVRREYVFGHEFDSVMNYPFRNAVVAFMLGITDARELNNTLQTLRERYPKPFYYAAMNLLSTHDIVRAITALGGAPDRDALTREQQAEFKLSKENETLGKARLIAATALQMSMPGVPSVYYGDEAGVSGMADPFNRKTYPWGYEDKEILAAFKAYMRARSGNPALKSGFCRMGAYNIDVFAVLRYTCGGKDAFGEETNDSAALCLINRARMPMHVRLKPEMINEGPDASIPVSIDGVWIEIGTGKRVNCASEIFETIVPSDGALLFVRQ